jgi:hypothetical protein
MPSELVLVKPVALPAQSAVATVYESTNLADAFAIQLLFGTSSNPEVLWRFLILQQPSWIGWLTNVCTYLSAAQLRTHLRDNGRCCFPGSRRRRTATRCHPTLPKTHRTDPQDAQLQSR